MSVDGLQRKREECPEKQTDTERKREAHQGGQSDQRKKPKGPALFNPRRANDLDRIRFRRR
jgi:hypothetical protein